MFRAIFVSDIHLTTLEDQRGRFFLSLLKAWRGPEPTSEKSISHLFLVGDIFDLWLSDHHFFINRFQPLIGEIRRLIDEGVEIHLFEGNHDLYLEKFWGQKLGVTVHGEPTVFMLNGRPVLIEHGDAYDPSDRGYHFLRWFLRTSVLRWLGEHLPQSAVVWLGTRAAASSRHYTSQVKIASPERIKQLLHLHARRMFEKYEVDLLINGHVHVTDDFAFDHRGRSVRAVNLGSWLGGAGRYFELTANSGKFYENNLGSSGA